MKSGVFITILLILSARFITAQCQANAGGNMHICMELHTTTATIGGTPTASGGTAPYTYCWSTDAIPIFPGSTLIFTASDFLNDTTAANPVVIANNLIADTTVFYLKVTDALGCVSYDTCQVTFSRFVYGLGYAIAYIDQTMINNGDSITINLINVSGSPYTPYSYIWQPAYGLSTTSLATGFQASPQVSTSYSVTIRDDRGCVSQPNIAYYVYVCPAGQVVGAFGMFCVPAGIKENSGNKINLSVYPNPASNNMRVELPDNATYTLKLSNALGSVCQEINSAEEKAEINLNRVNAGIYFLQVFEKGKLVATEKIIKE